MVVSPQSFCRRRQSPQVDAQAVDRVYRIGQKREVVTYRLMSTATIEEKKLRRQVFKIAMARQVLENRLQPAYSNRNELADLLFLAPDHKVSEVLNVLTPLQEKQRARLTARGGEHAERVRDCREHMLYLRVFSKITGVCDHSALFGEEAKGAPADPIEANDLLLAFGAGLARRVGVLMGGRGLKRDADGNARPAASNFKWQDLLGEVEEGGAGRDVLPRRPLEQRPPPRLKNEFDVIDV
jgi:hypothetical protein